MAKASETCKNERDTTDSDVDLTDDGSDLPSLTLSPTPELHPRGVTIEITHGIKNMTVNKCHLELTESTLTELAPKENEVDYKDPACYQFGQNKSLGGIKVILVFEITGENKADPQRYFLCIHFEWLVSNENPSCQVGFSQDNFKGISDFPNSLKIGGKTVKVAVEESSTTSASCLLSVKLS